MEYQCSKRAVPVRNRRGATTVEFALVGPLLLLIALAVSDFSRSLHFYEVVANAARTGAETGAIQQFSDMNRSDWEDDVEAAVLRELQNLTDFDVDKAQISLTTDVDEDDVVCLEVEVSYPFETTLAWPGLPSETPLRKSVEFRQFR